MLPSHYLAVKAAMLREAAQRGILPRSEARTMSRLDASRALKVCIACCMATINQAYARVYICVCWVANGLPSTVLLISQLRELLLCRFMTYWLPVAG